MKKYKIIFSDIDGTLLNDENQVPKETVEELQSLDKRGIPFVLVSARMSEGPPSKAKYSLVTDSA